GGQQQRVALARALVCAPSVLLLDEPFAALNPMLRQTLRSELAQVCAQWRTPVVMITHDVDDVLALADVAFVIEQGQAVREVDVRRGDGRELTQRALVDGWVAPTVTAAERSVRRWLGAPVRG
ncbi:MAG TPA: ATP-binding cassette domain-containing protein, partial [Variovorax sp.]